MQTLPTLFDARIDRAWPKQYGFSIVGPRLLGWQYIGSLAHGTAGTVIDDVDMFAVVTPPKSFWPFEHWVHQAEELDVLVYSVRKWLMLLWGSNPNMITTLGTPWELDLFPEGVIEELVVACRTKQAIKKTLGFADSHAKKLERGVYEGYMGAERKRLFDQFGFDPKDAAHMIRILRFGLEYANFGTLQVKRSDADELRLIKAGGWSLEQVKAEYDRLQNAMRKVLEVSDLPERPNPDHFNRIYRDLDI